jgi:hypothetical protein
MKILLSADNIWLRQNCYSGLVLLKINVLVNWTQRADKTLSRIFNIFDGVLAFNYDLMLSKSYGQ